MTPAEFQAAVRDMLTDPWGDKAYPKVALDRLWRMVHMVAVGEFRSALDGLLVTCIKAPSLGQIRGACVPAINRGLEELRAAKLKNLPDCRLCGKTGWVVAIPFDDVLVDVAFICRCEAAQVRGLRPTRGARLWSEEFCYGHFVREATTESVRQYADIMEKHYANVRELRRDKAAKRVLPASDLQEFAHELLQGVRSGKGLSEVLRQSLDLSEPKQDT